jgi:site-specific DNA-methyltransferase (adenine-specific)
MIEINKIYNEDCLEGMKRIEDNSIDILLTDPPYKYLKNQRLESDFNEIEFIKQVDRILKVGGFVVFFGRGTSFYRLNYLFSEFKDLNCKQVFNFKEEIIWNKSYISSPVMALSRVHETIAIYAKGINKINKVKIPFLKMKEYDFTSIMQDITRMKSLLKNKKSLENVENYLEINKDAIEENAFEDIIRKDFDGSRTAQKNELTGNKKNKTGDRNVTIMNSICVGMNEKSIIKEIPEKYKAIHPTQKPLSLLKRLLNLVIKNKNSIVLDPFSGSSSTAISCIELKTNFIGFELDKEYFDLGNERIEKHKEKLSESLFEENVIR